MAGRIQRVPGTPPEACCALAVNRAECRTGAAFLFTRTKQAQRGGAILALKSRPLTTSATVLLARVGSSLLSSNRFSVDLPATGAQSLRRPASLPASIAIIGSCRSSSLVGH
jgi:hypothetical protein